MENDRREEILRAADSRSYGRFTGPQRLDKALHTLEGLLKGAATDGVISLDELQLVRHWMREHSEHADRHPFNEIMALLDDVMADGVFDAEDAKDVLWVCQRFSTPNEYFAAIASDMQRLQGMLGGVIADGTVTEAELRALSEWADEHEHLKACWPFDELQSVIVSVLADKKIDADEHRMLLAMFSEFTEIGEHLAVDIRLSGMVPPVTGLCAVCPEVSFVNRLYCFTGKSRRATRREMAELIESLGGAFNPSVRHELDYLIIGADGNPAWAFACYGRKVELAMNYRKEGYPIVLVHENDFWDAVADAGR